MLLLFFSFALPSLHSIPSLPSLSLSFFLPCREAPPSNTARGLGSVGLLSAKLHYTATGYGHGVQHHQRTSSRQFYNLYNKFTTNGQKFVTSQHVDMSRCWTPALWCGKFVVQQVVELLWACPLVVLYNMSVADVRVVEFGTKLPSGVRVANTFSVHLEPRKRVLQLAFIFGWTSSKSRSGHKRFD